MKNYFIIVACLSLFGCTASKKTNNSKEGIQVSKIWDSASHSAFPDLIRFKGAFYCSFREGSGHVPGTNGKARVLRSADGQNWHSVALLETDGIDLRDPKISITKDNRIMVMIGGSVYGEGAERSKLLALYPHVSFSDEAGANFSAPEKITILPQSSGRDWLWRVTWHKKQGYGINYHNNFVDLVHTDDGKKYTKIAQLDVDGYPNESTVRLDENDRMYVLVRREEGDKLGVLAQSVSPYTNWTYKKLSMRLGGPNFILYGKNQMIIGSRLYLPEGAATGILLTDLEGNVKKTIKLQSGGDTSYPGLLLHEGKLWVAYYSSHEGKTSIYLAMIPVSEFNLLPN